MKDLLCRAAAMIAASAAVSVAASYESAWRDYRAFKADEPVVDWKRANERVREVGGHAGVMGTHAGHSPAAPAAPARAGTPAPAAVPARSEPAKPADPHAGHGKKAGRP